MKQKQDVRLAKYFMLNEFLSDKDPINPNYEQVLNLKEVAKKLNDLREIVGMITVTSGFRSPRRNKEVGGSKGSYHLTGEAADITFAWANWAPHEIFAICNHVGFGNCTVYTGGGRWVHVDIGKPWPKGVLDWARYSDTMSCRFKKV